MRNRAIWITVLTGLAGQVLAQPSPSIICNQDYYNASRYIGARNSARTVGGSVVAVFEPAGGYVNQEIWYVTWNTFFDEWDPPQQLSFSPQGTTGVPAVVADEEGNIWAGWKQQNQEGDRDMMAAIWDGVAWSAPMTADAIENNAGVNAIDIAADGTVFNLFSIWNDPPEYAANIYSSRSADGGESWVTDNLTAEFPTPDFLPLNYLDVALTPDADGGMYAAWEDRPFDESWEIVMSHFVDTSWSIPEVVTPIEDQLGTLKYVDGCTPAPDAQAIYLMGPEDYALAGHPAAVLNPDEQRPAFSCFFNLRYVDPDSTLDNLVGDVLDYFGAQQPLVVDDDNRYNHETHIHESLDRLGAAYGTFDCGEDSTGVEQLPELQDLENSDLVIWFCGDDGAGLAFWNEMEEDNQTIIDYLDGGGKLWVIGLDLLYDRYGGGPVEFVEGDFCRDYLGLASYDVQSWVDDGDVGLPQLDLAPDQDLTDEGPLTWSVSGAIRQGEPSLATTPDGMIHMCYVELDHIWYMRYNGSGWSQPVQMDVSPDTLSCYRPCITVDEDYGVYITWNQEQTLQPRLTNIFYAVSPDGGWTWNTPQQLSEATESNDYGNSVFKATIGRKVRPEIPDMFDGGADVVWVQWNAQSELGYDLMYGRIPYAGGGSFLANGSVRPAAFQLLPNRPNPFNPSTEIRFVLDRQGVVRLDVFNLGGELIETLAEGRYGAGEHSVAWHAEEAPSGIYFCRLRSAGGEQVRKMTLLR